MTPVFNMSPLCLVPPYEKCIDRQMLHDANTNTYSHTLYQTSSAVPGGFCAGLIFAGGPLGVGGTALLQPPKSSSAVTCVVIAFAPKPAPAPLVPQPKSFALEVGKGWDLRVDIEVVVPFAGSSVLHASFEPHGSTFERTEPTPDMVVLRVLLVGAGVFGCEGALGVDRLKAELMFGVAAFAGLLVAGCPDAAEKSKSPPKSVLALGLCGDAVVGELAEVKSPKPLD